MYMKRDFKWIIVKHFIHYSGRQMVGCGIRGIKHPEKSGRAVTKKRLTQGVRFFSPSDLHAALGSSVELPCVDGRTNGSEWRLNRTFLVSSPVLRLHNTSLDDQGFYMCHDSNGELIENVRLQLGCE